MLTNAKNALLGNAFLRRIFAALRWVFGPAAVAFLVVAGVRARGAFHEVSLHTQLLPLAITVLLWASLNLIVPAFTWLVLREAGVAISYRAVLGIHVGRLPARYLPGGIWQTVSRMMDLHRLGVERSQLSTLVMLENLVPLSLALAMGGACILIAGDAKLFALAATLGGLTLLLCLPFLLRHRLLLHNRGFAPRTYLVAALVTVVFWIIAATAFACYWFSFSTTQADVSWLQVYGAYLLAWSAGFISVFSPQGIGVFESMISLLLKGALPFGEAAVLAAGFRVATLMADLATYSTLLIGRYGRRVLRLNRY